MHQQIRVAPDGRGEVGVMLIGEAKVSTVVRCVNRLRQRTQQHRMQRGCVDSITRLLDQRGVVLRLGAFTTAEREPAQRQRFA